MAATNKASKACKAYPTGGTRGTGTGRLGGRILPAVGKLKAPVENRRQEPTVEEKQEVQNDWRK